MKRFACFLRYLALIGFMAAGILLLTVKRKVFKRTTV